MALPEAWADGHGGLRSSSPGRLRAPGGLRCPFRRSFGRPGGAGRLAGLVVRAQHGLRPTVRPPTGRPRWRFLHDHPGCRLPRRAGLSPGQQCAGNLLPYRRWQRAPDRVAQQRFGRPPALVRIGSPGRGPVRTGRAAYRTGARHPGPDRVALDAQHAQWRSHARRRRHGDPALLRAAGNPRMR